MVDRGDNTYGGKYVVNPSGGLISKGHPLGATGKYSDLIVTIIMLPVQVRLRDTVILIYLSREQFNCAVKILLSDPSYNLIYVSGLAQCTELCLQLRGECGPRQVPGAKVALQHNLGLGGAVVVALYRMG